MNMSILHSAMNISSVMFFSKAYSWCCVQDVLQEFSWVISGLKWSPQSWWMIQLWIIRDIVGFCGTYCRNLFDTLVFHVISNILYSILHSTLLVQNTYILAQHWEIEMYNGFCWKKNVSFGSWITSQKKNREFAVSFCRRYPLITLCTFGDLWTKLRHLLKHAIFIFHKTPERYPHFGNILSVKYEPSCGRLCTFGERWTKLQGGEY